MRRFLDALPPDQDLDVADSDMSKSFTESTNVDELTAEFGARSYGRGRYRIHASSRVPFWSSLARAAYPMLSTTVSAFGSDWQGRLYVIENPPAGSTVLQLDIHWGEIIDTENGLLDFHDRSLVADGDEYLSPALYAAWLASGGAIPSLEQCVEFEVPLFLGGEQNLTNMALTSTEVLWTLTAQLLGQTRDLPPGTPITGVRFDNG